MTTIYERYDPVTTRYTEIVMDAETGLPIITYTQNTRAIIEANKRQANAFAGPNKDGITKVASIPMVVWQRLMQTGVAHDQNALNAWLNERDNRVFRTDDARRL